jgi:hypothetical protein
MENAQKSSAEDYFQVRDFEQVILDGGMEKPRRKICGAFLYEDTTTLLFSRTNYGKSMLAFQFAWCAATGTNLDPCNALLNECEPMKVMVVDLELDDRDLFERHGAVLQSGNPYIHNLLYLHEKIDNKMMVGYALIDKIEKSAVAHQAKLVIIDNISKLLPDALKPDTATFIIAMLDRVRRINGCSILVIGHMTKGNPRICIQPTDYYGSAMLQNFIHELFFLDMTRDGSFFLCHSKTKHEECYMQNVPVFSRGRHPRFGIGFNYISLQSLSDIQLPEMLVPQVKQRPRNLSAFKKDINILLDAGRSQSDIARFANVTPSAVNHYLKTEYYGT